MRLLACASLLAAIVVASPAASAKDALKRVGVTGGFAGLAGNEGDFSGYGGGILGSYGLSDAWSLAGSAFITSNQVTKTGGRSRVTSQAVGFVYALDVIELVPYFGFYVGLYEIAGGGVSKADVKLGGQLSIGLDYIVSRDFILGIDLRAHALPADFAKSPDNPSPFYATTFLKAEYAWGWF